MIGLIVLAYLIVLEFIMYYHQLKTKRYQHHRKRVIRIFSIVFIGLLTLFNAFSWGFRYFPILLVYLLLILINEISLSTYKKKRTYINRWHLLRSFIMSCLLFGLALLPALIFPTYKPLGITGFNNVYTSYEVYVDENRQEDFSISNKSREIGVRSFFPIDTNQTYPLVIYSHGGISLDTSNTSLLVELASHGYIVLSISHSYHSLLTIDSNGRAIGIDSTYMRELNQENASEDPQNSFELYQKWMKLRTDDISFVIDQVKYKIENNRDFSFYNLIDIERIGVVGHSLGGSAALCMGRLRDDIKAVIALESPLMCDITGVNDDGFIFDDRPYPIPVLNIYSDSAYENLSVWPQYKKNYLLLTSTNEISFNHHIEGTYHFSLTDLSLTSPIITRLLNGSPSTKGSRETLKKINTLSLEFFDNYLKS